MKVKVTNAGLVPPNPLPISSQPIVSNNAVINQVPKSTNIEKSNSPTINLANITTTVVGGQNQQLNKDTNGGGLLQGIPNVNFHTTTEENKINTGLTASSLVFGKAITSASLITTQPKTKVGGSVKVTAAKPNQKNLTEPVIINTSCIISNNTVTALNNNTGNGNVISKQPNKRKIKTAAPAAKGKAQKAPSTTQSHLVPATIAVSSTANFVTRNSIISTSLSSFTTTTTPSGFTVLHVPQPTAPVSKSQDLFSVPVSKSDVLNLSLPPQLTNVFNKALTHTTSADQSPRVAAAVSNNKLLPNAGHLASKTDSAPNTCVTQKSSTSLPASQGERRIYVTPATASALRLGNHGLILRTEGGPVVSLRQDIISMLYGFGGIKNPAEDAISFIERMLKAELQSFVLLCEQAAEIRQSKVVGFYETIFVLRREKFRLHKLFKYFAEKDVYEQALLDNKSGQNTELHNYTDEIRTVVEDLDSAGELIRVFDNECSEVLKELKKQEDLKTRNLSATSPKFYKFMTALGMSLSRKLTNMQKWCSQKLLAMNTFSPLFIEILSFLTYEIVAHIVELALIIRWERQRFFRSRIIGFQGLNPDTCMSEASYHRKRKDEDCKNVSEILVQASEMEAKRLKTVGATIEQVPVPTPTETTTTITEIDPSTRQDLRIEDVFEAYRRIQDVTVVPCLSYRCRVLQLGR